MPEATDTTLAMSRPRNSVLRGVGRSLGSALTVARRDPYAAIGLAIYVAFALIAIFADHLVTHDPLEILFTKDYDLARNLPPNSEFWLGTTYSGRDIYSQLIMGTRSALIVGLTAAVCVVASAVFCSGMVIFI